MHIRTRIIKASTNLYPAVSSEQSHPGGCRRCALVLDGTLALGPEAATPQVTAMTFCCGLENDLMVAYADHSICIVKSDTGFAAAKLTSHRARV